MLLQGEDLELVFELFDDLGIDVGTAGALGFGGGYGHLKRETTGDGVHLLCALSLNFHRAPGALHVLLQLCFTEGFFLG